MLTTLVVIVFVVALAGGAALCACSCACKGEESCAAPAEKTWWRAKGLSVYAEPHSKPRRAARFDTGA